MLWETAKLQPNCFWGAEASWQLTETGVVRNKTCTLMFGSWSDMRAVAGDALVQMLSPGFVRPKGANRYEHVRSVLSEVQTRGPEAIEAVLKGYRSASDPSIKSGLLQDLREVCTWPDNSRVVLEFARGRKALEPDPQLREELGYLEEWARYRRQLLFDIIADQEVIAREPTNGLAGAPRRSNWVRPAAVALAVIMVLAAGVALLVFRFRRRS
jgi:hypothetical protein